MENDEQKGGRVDKQILKEVALDFAPVDNAK